MPVGDGFCLCTRLARYEKRAIITVKYAYCNQITSWTSHAQPAGPPCLCIRLARCMENPRQTPSPLSSLHRSGPTTNSQAAATPCVMPDCLQNACHLASVSPARRLAIGCRAALCSLVISQLPQVSFPCTQKYSKWVGCKPLTPCSLMQKSISIRITE